jgi:hypothetical protein
MKISEKIAFSNLMVMPCVIGFSLVSPAGCLRRLLAECFGVMLFLFDDTDEL